MLDDSLTAFWEGSGLSEEHSGIYRYAQNILYELQKVGISPQVIGGLMHKKLFKNNASYSRIYNFLQKLPIHRFLCPHFSEYLIRQKDKKKIILHSLSNINTSFLFNRVENIKRVLTVHDLIPLLYPDSVSRAYYFQFKLSLKRALDSSDAIICVSKWTQEKVCEFNAQAENKTVLIQNGYKQKKYISSPNLNLFFSLKKENYINILCVSRYEKYKRFNIPLKLLKNQSFRIFFVTNQKGALFLKKNGKQFLLNKRLVVCENLCEKTLDHLYSFCDVYLNTSMCEGFGLPALESLVQHTPVVYQKGTALDEVLCEDVSVCLESNASTQQWEEAVYKASSYKQNMTIFAGLVQKHLSKLQTWQTAAFQIQKLYNDL